MTGYIQQKRSFEYKIIGKLLRSKEYLGRNIHTSESEAYLKNKKICNLIDKIRYCHSEELIRKIKKKLRESKLTIDGGDSASKYTLYQRIDLGAAGCPVANLEGPGIPFAKLEIEKCLGKIDGGNSFDFYAEEYRIELGRASSGKADIQIPTHSNCDIDGGYSDDVYCPNTTIDLGGAADQFFVPYQYGNAKIQSKEEY